MRICSFLQAGTNLAITRHPLRILRFFALVFQVQCVRGNAAQRKRIVTRVTRHLARVLGIYPLSILTFRLKQQAAGLIRKRGAATANERPCQQWLHAIVSLDNRDYLRSWIERRYEGGPKVIVLAIGSIGDILQITPALRALREKLPAAEICLLHRSLAAGTVLQGNRNIDCVAVADRYHFDEITTSVREEGAADLVVEIVNISFILTYTPAPLELRHPELSAVFPESFFAAAAAAQESWKRHPPIYPRREARFVWPEEWKQFQYLDVLGATGNLPIDRYSALDFVIAPEDMTAIELFKLKRPYVTVQNGIDAFVVNWSRATGQRPTKLLPKTTWEETIRLLRAGNLAVIQLGTEEDEPLRGVDMDLRGRTTLRQAAVILQNAVCHVGTEGALVHLARAMAVRSVVAFGPTSASFLGYPQNVNLVATDCTGCWWTTKDWYIYCPLGFETPPCMNAFAADMIAGAALRIFEGDAASEPTLTPSAVRQSKFIDTGDAAEDTDLSRS
jgi:ADP-heptose:LPS heptosyltransferase